MTDRRPCPKCGKFMGHVHQTGGWLCPIKVGGCGYSDNPGRVEPRELAAHGGQAPASGARTDAGRSGMSSPDTTAVGEKRDTGQSHVLPESASAGTVHASEKDVQEAIKKFLRALPTKFCVEVWDTSQPFRAAIRPGLPDLLVFWLHGFFFVEVKTATGKQSDGQKVFETACKRAAVPYYIWRGVNDAAAWWNARTPG